MPYCTNCGEEVSEDQEYCSYCGDRLGSGSTQQHPPEGGREVDSREESGWGSETGNESSEWGESDQQDEWADEPVTASPADAGSAGGPIPRKNAVDTMTDAATWLFGLPVLIGAFLAVEFVNSLASIFGPGTGSILQLVGAVAMLLVNGAAYRYVESELFGGRFEFGEAINEVTGRLLSLIGVLLIYVIAVGIGLVLLIIPGIYIGARLFLAFPACVLDGHGAIDSISVSWDVAGGNVAKLVGIFLLSLIPVLLLSAFGAGAGGAELLASPVFLLITAPLSAIITGIVEMAGARVYIENRHTQTTTT